MKPKKNKCQYQDLHKLTKDHETFKHLARNYL